jgi:hypothetical protein
MRWRQGSKRPRRSQVWPGRPANVHQLPFRSSSSVRADSRSPPTPPTAAGAVTWQAWLSPVLGCHHERESWGPDGDQRHRQRPQIPPKRRIVADCPGQAEHAQIDGAPTWGSRGRRFKSCQPDWMPVQHFTLQRQVSASARHAGREPSASRCGPFGAAERRRDGRSGPWRQRQWRSRPDAGNAGSWSASRARQFAEACTGTPAAAIHVRPADRADAAARDGTARCLLRVREQGQYPVGRSLATNASPYIRVAGQRRPRLRLRCSGRHR